MHVHCNPISAGSPCEIACLSF